MLKKNLPAPRHQTNQQPGKCLHVGEETLVPYEKQVVVLCTEHAVSLQDRLLY